MTERPSADADHTFAVSFRPDTASLAGARHRFEQWLRADGSAQERAEDLSVVFSEVASNAVDAHDGTDEPVSARAWREGDEIVLSVANTVTSQLESTDRWDLDDPLRGGGRGLMIVRALTDDVGVEVVNQTITIECRLRLDHS